MSQTGSLKFYSGAPRSAYGGRIGTSDSTYQRVFIIASDGNVYLSQAGFSCSAGETVIISGYYYIDSTSS